MLNSIKNSHPLTVGSETGGVRRLIISVTVTAKVTEEGRKPSRKHSRQTPWQKRMKRFEK